VYWIIYCYIFDMYVATSCEIFFIVKFLHYYLVMSINH